MNSIDLINILQWWGVIFLTGITFLPLTAIIFNQFKDKGYIFAKILGILLLSYLIWLLASLKLLPFTSTSLFILIAVFLAINLYLTYKKNALQNIQSIFKLILLEEILFTVGLIFWSFIKSFEPSIHSLEKFMDYGFVNSILRSDFFPPKDIWLTPFSINYYYFGHLVTAVIIKISSIEATVGYNLSIASLFALTLAASFSIGLNLYHLFIKSSSSQPTIFSLLAGLISSFLVTLGGNLQTIYIFFKTYTPADNPIPFWKLPLEFNPLGYWYPNATRFIPFTIHEFPIYSFVVSDLHGHVSNIPFVLLIIALLISLFHSPKLYARVKLGWQVRLAAIHYTLLSLLIAVSLMTNVLDGPIYLLVIFLVLLLASHFSFLTSLKNTLLIVLGAILLSLPFWLSFVPFGSGIGVLCAPDFLINIGKIGPFLFEANHCARSPLWMLGILWGFPLFVVLSFLFYCFYKRIPRPLGRGETHVLQISNLKFIKNFKLKISNSIDLFTIILALSAFLLILIPEFFYVKDIYPAHYRANTVFKFGYQAFIILGLISGYMIIRIISNKSKSIFYFLSSIFLISLFALVALYPYFAINSYYGNLKNYQGLNGINYLSTLYPDDYQAILWLNQNIKGQPIILEAQGDSYTDFARISANTGLPTIIGWPVHEWLWRGSYDEPGKRSTDVTTLYETKELATAQALLKKYNVSYVFVGRLERQKYLNLDEAKFAQLGKIIFQSGETKIYKIG